MWYTLLKCRLSRLTRCDLCCSPRRDITSIFDESRSFSTLVVLILPLLDDRCACLSDGLDGGSRVASRVRRPGVV